MVRNIAISSLLAGLLLLPRTAHAQRYELTGESQLFEGCVGGLCACPVQISSELSGQMAVVGAGLDQYKIREVRFEGVTNAKPIVFTGDGFYQRRDVGALREHRLELTLSAGGDDPVDYDSGWMPLIDESEVIAIAVAPPPETCYGYAFGLVARPTTAADSESPSWATVKADW